MLEFEPPYPSLIITDRRHPYLPRRAVAAAVIDEDGDEHLAFSYARIRSPKPLLPLVLHEMSHLKAWRVHGHDMLTHGFKFNEICRKVASRTDCARVSH